MAFNANLSVEDPISAHRYIDIGYSTNGMHIHDYYVIFMSMTDGLHYLVNDQIYDINRGDVMLFSDSDLYGISVPPNIVYDRFFIVFLPYVLFPEKSRYSALLNCFHSGGETPSHKLSLNEAELSEFIALANSIEAEICEPQFGVIGESVALMNLLLFLNRLNSHMAGTSMPVRSGSHAQIRRVIDYINENYEKPITLDELSELCFFNKSYLSRLFHRETGFSIQDYIIFRRLSHAIELIHAGYKIGEAARLSGFNSETYFITIFKRRVGVTPYQYRQSWMKLAHQ